jgi:hypothetical protein
LIITNAYKVKRDMRPRVLFVDQRGELRAWVRFTLRWTLQPLLLGAASGLVWIIGNTLMQLLPSSTATTKSGPDTSLASGATHTEPRRRQHDNFLS